MDNFIFKGISSESFKIVVNSLPPISKPAMRVEETSINGVDGTTFEDLGYGSYDKKIKITITENNIDELIGWLNGEGELVLSNEPDKYYKAKVIGQIDFKRLIKYEPVEVTFRVQPFKYEYNEEKSMLLEQEATGTEIEINDGKVLNISVDGRSTQEGTPTPEASIEIQNVGNDGTVEIKQTGKNIFDINATYISDSASIDINENDIIVTSYSTGLARVQFPIDYKLNTKYTLSFDATILEGLNIGLIPNVRIRKNNSSLAITELIMTEDKTHYEAIIPPLEEEGYELWLYLKTDASISGIMTVKFENIQIEKGTVATEYKPYIKEEICTIVLDEPLRSLPNGTKDMLKIENDKLSVHRFIGSVVLDGNETWKNNGNAINTNGYYEFSTVISDMPTTQVGLLCNKFQVGNVYDSSKEQVRNREDNKIYINILSSRLESTDIEGFKTWLSTNNVEVLYELEYPMVTETVDKTGKYTMSEGAIIISNSDDANMVVTYIGNKLIVNNKGNDKAKPIIKIKGTSYIEFILNDNMLFSYIFPDGEDTVIIDSQKQDAYLDTVLKNRNMSGEFPIFEKGENVITWYGTVENIEITQKSRWI